MHNPLRSVDTVKSPKVNFQAWVRDLRSLIRFAFSQPFYNFKMIPATWNVELCSRSCSVLASKSAGYYSSFLKPTWLVTRGIWTGWRRDLLQQEQQKTDQKDWPNLPSSDWTKNLPPRASLCASSKWFSSHLRNSPHTAEHTFTSWTKHTTRWRQESFASLPMEWYDFTGCKRC